MIASAVSVTLIGVGAHPMRVAVGFKPPFWETCRWETISMLCRTRVRMTSRQGVERDRYAL